MAAFESPASRAGDDRRASRIAVTVVLGMVGIFAAIVVWVTATLRGDIREQFMSRDAHVLSLLLQHRIAQAEGEHLVFGFEVLDSDQLWAVILDVAAAEGVVAAQLFAPTGERLRSTSESLVSNYLPPAALQRVQSGGAVGEFQRELPLSELMRLGYREDEVVSILNLYLPLKSTGGELLGASRFLLDGSLLAEEFALLDRRLLLQASIATSVGSALVVGLFWLAWRRLNAAKAVLQQQATRLRKANTELAMLARASAVGSVAAHLIHGLKNPLAGLRQVVGQGSAPSPEAAEEWEGAREAANRMQSLIEEVVGVLQDAANPSAAYEWSLQELAEEIRRRYAGQAARRQIEFTVEIRGAGSLESHRANIVLLILDNLLQNALEAVEGTGGRVGALLEAEKSRAALTVSDSGPGVAVEARDTLFAPVQSSKEGGAGIGLAISNQLARHLGGELRYVAGEGEGAVFQLSLPLVEAEVS